MRIKEIHSQHRRDFIATIECEHCNATRQIRGYDDERYHNHVLPKLHCAECDKQAPDTYRPLATKYPDDFQI